MIRIDHIILIIALLIYLSIHLTNAKEKKMLLGAPQPLNLTKMENRKKIDDFVDISLKYMKNNASQLKNLNNMELIRIRNATRQIVAGSLYRIDFYVGNPSCFKQKSNQPSACINDSNYKLCSVELLTQLWVSKVPQLEQYSCRHVHEEEALNSADLINLYYDST